MRGLGLVLVRGFFRVIGLSVILTLLVRGFIDMDAMLCGNKSLFDFWGSD